MTGHAREQLGVREHRDVIARREAPDFKVDFSVAKSIVSRPTRRKLSRLMPFAGAPSAAILWPSCLSRRSSHRSSSRVSATRPANSRIFSSECRPNLSSVFSAAATAGAAGRAAPARDEDAEAAAVDRLLVDVEHFHSDAAREHGHGLERQVAQVLVVDRVELEIAHHLQSVRGLEDEYAVVGEQVVDAFHEVDEVVDVREYVGAGD